MTIEKITIMVSIEGQKDPLFGSLAYQGLVRPSNADVLRIYQTLEDAHRAAVETGHVKGDSKSEELKPNHYYNDGLGDPATCTEDHNHPESDPKPSSNTTAVNREWSPANALKKVGNA